MTDRERLERVISDALTESLRDGRPVVACLADAVERVRLAAPAPTTPPVWPGLEGEGLRRAVDAWNLAMPVKRPEGMGWDDVDRRCYTAVAAHLWRAMVASLPACSAYPEERWAQVGGAAVSRTNLAALADPYDGGGK